MYIYVLYDNEKHFLMGDVYAPNEKSALAHFVKEFPYLKNYEWTDFDFVSLQTSGKERFIIPQSNFIHYLMTAARCSLFK